MNKNNFFANFVCFNFIAFPRKFGILKATLNVEFTLVSLKKKVLNLKKQNPNHSDIHVQNSRPQNEVVRVLMFSFQIPYSVCTLDRLYSASQFTSCLCLY